MAALTRLRHAHQGRSAHHLGGRYWLCPALFHGPALLCLIHRS